MRTYPFVGEHVHSNGGKLLVEFERFEVGTVISDTRNQVEGGVFLVGTWCHEWCMQVFTEVK